MSEKDEIGKMSDAELYMYAKLHRKYGKTYEDPFIGGPVALSQHFDAFFEFVKQNYGDTSDNNSGAAKLTGLLVNQIKIKVGEEDGATVRLDYHQSTAHITIPKIPGQSQEEEKARIEDAAKAMWSTLSSGLHEIISEIIRGMPQEGRKVLLKNYGAKKETDGDSDETDNPRS